MILDLGERTIDIGAADAEGLREVRRNIQMVFQDPYSSLNPRMTILKVVGEPLTCNRVSSGKELEDRVQELLEQVGLRKQYLKRYPHAFSGGQRQRISLARALAIGPKLIVADEPVSALDVSVQAQILNLFNALKEKFSLSMLFISHDLSVVRHVSDRIMVMYLGQIVEEAETESLFEHPMHPYTEALFSAVPSINPEMKSKRIVLHGEPPDPSREFTGCRFAERCAYAQERCRVESPPLQPVGPDKTHRVACFYPR